jgi:hypothetical protein
MAGLIIVCLPVRGSENRLVAPGARRGVCSFCESGVWVSLSSRELAAQSDRRYARLSCTHCAKRLMRRHRRERLDKDGGPHRPQLVSAYLKAKGRSKSPRSKKTASLNRETTNAERLDLLESLSG